MSKLNVTIAPEIAALLEQVAYQTPAAPPEPDSTSSSRLGLRLGQTGNMTVFLGSSGEARELVSDIRRELAGDGIEFFNGVSCT